MVALYAAIPLLFYFRLLPNAPLPALVLAAALAWLWLRRRPGAQEASLWNWPAARAGLARILPRTVLGCAVIGAGVAAWMPDRLFRFVRQAPGFWALVMILYPVISATAQELLYRAFFFHRYRPLLGQGAGAVAASAVLFGFAHIIFGAWLSVALSALGGVLFSLTYLRSGSLALAAIEHAIYGDFLFTIGLGEFFYHGARR
jgi:membrane protease YdiL (CAAX protease family)